MNAVNTILTETLFDKRECPGRDCCSDCILFIQNGNGYCQGCDEEYRLRCLKRFCYTNCNRCAGGKNAFTSGCCGRAPELTRQRWEKLLQSRVPDYAPAPVDINCRLIPVIHSAREFNIPEKFPEIDAWAVPVHKVLNKDGTFRTKNLKKHLGLRDHQKLIISTNAPDDYQELLWKKGHKLGYREHGVDYWFPGHFSIYDNDSLFYQFASAKRQQLHSVWTRSQFVWFRLGECIPIQYLQPIRNSHSVLISTGQMISKGNREILRQEVEMAHKWFPPTAAFFFVGGLGHLKGINFEDRPCYQINSSWLMRGLKGYNMARQSMEGILEKPDVLVCNLREVLNDVRSRTV